MRVQLRLGSVLGIPIQLHYSWAVVAALVVISLARFFDFAEPKWSDSLTWTLAVITAVLFFGSLVLHELAHAAVARSRGLSVRSITLFALGGVAQIGKDAADPRTEFWMGIVGPLTSAAIGLLCLGAAAAIGAGSDGPALEPAGAVLAWLGIINLGIAAFNMIPGFPLDGGRVLRAIAWFWTGNLIRATRLAARVGELCGYLLIVFGLYRFFGGAGLPGLWLAFLGWFLLEVASGSAEQTLMSEAMRGLTAADVMAKELPTVDGRKDLRVFIDEDLLRTGRRYFLVRGEGDGRIDGVITSDEVRTVEPGLWSSMTVGKAMWPMDRIRTIAPETPLSEALELMSREQFSQIPVARNGKVEGLLARGQILNLWHARAEIQA